MNSIKSHRDLMVWQKSVDLVVVIYTVTNLFPEEEKFGLTSQMRRCIVSIPSNIAEGRRRGTRKDFAKFIRIAFGSGAELETQLEISRRLKFLNQEQYEKILRLLTEIMKMLNKMISSLSKPAPTSHNLTPNS